jgi:hypothetical protein
VRPPDYHKNTEDSQLILLSDAASLHVFGSPPGFCVSTVNETLVILTGDSTLGCDGVTSIKMPRGTKVIAERSRLALKPEARG